MSNETHKSLKGKNQKSMLKLQNKYVTAMQDLSRNGWLLKTKIRDINEKVDQIHDHQKPTKVVTQTYTFNSTQVTLRENNRKDFVNDGYK